MSVSDYQKITLTALLSVTTTLAHESEAVQNLSNQYQNDLYSRVNLANSLKIFYETNLKGGKVVACGIGKSYKIATKVVATLKSLSINSDILHPSEALHGDLGLLHERDCLLLFTASGNTPELLELLPHISTNIPIVLLTCTKVSKLSEHPQVKSLLYAELPEHLNENTIHGLPAPTISTTLTLVLADAVVLALSEMIVSDNLKRKKTFSMKHPGGSIGSNLSHLNENLARMNSFPNTASNMQGLHDSYSSLLSLSQVRKCFNLSEAPDSLINLNASSIASSDNEESTQSQNADAKLSIKLKNAPSYLFTKISKEDLLKWREVDLLKHIALYDYLLFDKGKKTYGLESSRIRSLYKIQMTDTDNAEWSIMAGIVDAFHLVEL